MKVTRDFWTDRATRTDVYEWRVEFEGQQYVVQERMADISMRYGTIPLVELEHRAQRQIMRAIQEKLFGDRAL